MLYQRLAVLLLAVPALGLAMATADELDPARVAYVEDFCQGLPLVRGDLASADAGTHARANPHFEIQGRVEDAYTGITLPDKEPDGSIHFGTVGALDDIAVIRPHRSVQAGEVTAWNTTAWPVEKNLSWECLLRNGSASWNIKSVFAGLKTSADPAPDQDGVYFRWDHQASRDRWLAVESAGGTTTTTELTSHPAGIFTRFEEMHLKIETYYEAQMGAWRARFYIDGQLLHTSGPLTATAELVPFVGIKQVAMSNGEWLFVRGLALARDF